MLLLKEPFMLLPLLVFVPFPPVIELFIDLSTNEGRNGSAVGKNGVVPLMFAINDRVRLKGMIVTEWMMTWTCVAVRRFLPFDLTWVVI